MSETYPAAIKLQYTLEHPAIERLRQDVDLAQGARRGGLWLAASSWGAQAAQFAVSLVMARLLLPSQFGETTLVYAIAGFGVIFTDLGLSAAIIHARRVTRELLDTAFWLNAVSGFVLTALLCAAAFPLASLYGNKKLAGLFIVLSFDFALDLGSIHLSLLERTFHFRRVAFIETPAAIAGFISMPLFVLAGFGVYSIVLSPLVATVITTVALWVWVPYRPKRHFSVAAMGQIWRFSRGLVGSNTLSYWSRNLDNVMLGFYVSDASLGEYNRAYNLMMIPITQVTTVLMRGLYPALARLQDDPQRMGRVWVRSVATAGGAFLLPLTLTFAATAPALVHVLYGQNWSGMVRPLEILCLAAVPQMIGASTGAPYRAANKTALGFYISLWNTAVTVVAIVVGVHWGTVGVATALFIKSFINVWTAVLPLTRFLRLRTTRDVVVPLFTSWAPGLLIGGGELALRLVWTAPPPEVILAGQLAVGLGLYALIISLSRGLVATEMRLLMRTALGRA
jgi:O-antigen/teichoic acid export membrane protein